MTLGRSKYEALHRLADALAEYDELKEQGTVADMGEFWWVLDLS